MKTLKNALHLILMGVVLLLTSASMLRAQQDNSIADGRFQIAD